MASSLSTTVNVVASPSLQPGVAPEAPASPAPGVDLSEASLQARAFADALRGAQAVRAKAAPTIEAPTFDASTNTIGNKLINGLEDISGKLKSDHRNISRQIELAVDTGDDRMMMKAMMAVSDYQQRVQMVSKTVSKAGSSLDQLTKLQ
jgi:Type III secretion basal body protein I, YscI, HrpB, PscI